MTEVYQKCLLNLFIKVNIIIIIWMNPLTWYLTIIYNKIWDMCTCVRRHENLKIRDENFTLLGISSPTSFNIIIYFYFSIVRKFVTYLKYNIKFESWFILFKCKWSHYVLESLIKNQCFRDILHTKYIHFKMNLNMMKRPCYVHPLIINKSITQL